VTIDEYGFEILSHTTEFSEFTSEASVESYKKETESVLRDTFGACYVKTYDFILRKNIPFYRKTFDLRDPLHTEGPARGAHNGRSTREHSSWIRYYTNTSMNQTSHIAQVQRLSHGI